MLVHGFSVSIVVKGCVNLPPAMEFTGLGAFSFFPVCFFPIC